MRRGSQKGPETTALSKVRDMFIEIAKTRNTHHTIVSDAFDGRDSPELRKSSKHCCEHENVFSGNLNLNLLNVFSASLWLAQVYLRGPDQYFECFEGTWERMTVREEATGGDVGANDSMGRFALPVGLAKTRIDSLDLNA